MVPSRRRRRASGSFLRLNVEAVVALTRGLLPPLLARGQGGSSTSPRRWPSSRGPYRRLEKEAGMSTNTMTIEDESVLVTGANRGIGQALVEEALRRGAGRVYAGTRGHLTHADRRVTPVRLDVTDTSQIQAAVERVDALDVLINNAGVSLPDDLGDRAALERHLAVNLFGTYGVTQAFVPLLTRSRGAIVNIVSVAALASVPVLPAYSISKAAAFSLSQSLRALLSGQGVSVHAVLAGPVDTDMIRDLDIPKFSPESVAQGILDGVENGEDEIFPDPMSASMAESWRGGPAKALERQNAALVQAEPDAA
jgi:NAD(P)-dependent dehydrogenase (short-subunit alcohol dehydrogenase family)